MKIKKPVAQVPAIKMPTIQVPTIQIRTIQVLGIFTGSLLMGYTTTAFATDSLEEQILKTEQEIAQKQKKLAQLQQIKPSSALLNSSSSNSASLESTASNPTGSDNQPNKNEDHNSHNNNINTNNINTNNSNKDNSNSSNVNITTNPNNTTNTSPNLAKAEPKEAPKPPPPPPKTPDEILAKVLPPYDFESKNGNKFMEKTNKAKWYKGMKINPYTTVRLQVLLDWNHSSPGPIDKTWGMNSRKAIRAFEKMHGLKVDGKMDAKVWQLLNQGRNAKLPALVKYTITKADVRTRFRRTPKGYAAKARDWELSYNNIYEMFGERFHMSIGLLKSLNKGIKFRAGKTITVVNVGRHNNEVVDNILVDKRRNILYAYNGKRIVATYPTTIGARTPKAGRTYSMVGKVYMPTYKAETAEKRYILPPGPNNPVGVAWMALSKPTFGIHGSPQPEGISRQRSHGCVRLTNWDASELFATIKKGARVRFK